MKKSKFIFIVLVTLIPSNILPVIYIYYTINKIENTVYYHTGEHSYSLEEFAIYYNKNQGYGASIKDKYTNQPKEIRDAQTMFFELQRKYDNIPGEPEVSTDGSGCVTTYSKVYRN